MTNPKTDNPELNLATLFADYNDEDEARGLLESLRWPNGAICPHCRADKPYALAGKPDSRCKIRAGLYKCRSCRKQFTFKVGSIFEDSKIPCSKWCMAIALLCSSKKAVSSHQMRRMLGVTQKTAWFMSHRIRHACDEFSFRWNTRKLTDGERFVEAVAMTAGKRLKYRETVAA